MLNASPHVLKALVVVCACAVLFLLFNQPSWTSFHVPINWDSQLDDTSRCAPIDGDGLHYGPEASTPAEGPAARPAQSTCSAQATARGPGQRVVSFNYYGKTDHPRLYFAGIEGNTDAVRRLYPGWTMRLYHEVKEADNATWSVLRHLESKYPNLDLCNISSVPVLGNLQGTQKSAWRFLAMGDPLVDVFVSRDLDSRPSPRESAAVDDWLAQNASFHVMRDHPGGHRVRMLAGMWGARMDLSRERVLQLSRQMSAAASKPGPKSCDQRILADVLWPKIRGSVIQHDSYFCADKLFAPHGNMRPWPTRRLTSSYNFVGFEDGVHGNPMLAECPLKCRPPNHLDWIYC